MATGKEVTAESVSKMVEESLTVCLNGMINQITKDVGKMNDPTLLLAAYRGVQNALSYNLGLIKCFRVHHESGATIDTVNEEAKISEAKGYNHGLIHELGDDLGEQ